MSRKLSPIIKESELNDMDEICSKCNQPHEKMLYIDEKPICITCLYGDIEPVTIYPIGFVKNDQQRAVKGFGLKKKDKTSKIELLESQKPFMYKLEDEKMLTIIYYLHKSGSVKSVFNRGIDGKKTGVFASRTPNRLSCLAIQNVYLKKIENMILWVEGLDAIDGSPVLDIKMG